MSNTIQHRTLIGLFNMNMGNMKHVYYLEGQEGRRKPEGWKVNKFRKIILLLWSLTIIAQNLAGISHNHFVPIASKFRQEVQTNKSLSKQEFSQRSSQYSTVLYSTDQYITMRKLSTILCQQWALSKKVRNSKIKKLQWEQKRKSVKIKNHQLESWP